MLVNNYKKFLNLSRVLNSSFGTEGAVNKKYSTQSVKFDLLDDGMIKCRFMTIIAFGSDSMMREMMVRHQNEGLNMLETALKEIKDRYKMLFPEDPVPTFKVLKSSISDDVEFLNYNMYSSTRRAYYRLGCLIEVE